MKIFILIGLNLNFYLKERSLLRAIWVDINDFHLIERSYRQNKSIPLLRQMIVKIKAVKTGIYKNIIAILFILNWKMNEVQKLSLTSLIETQNLLYNRKLGHLHMY